MTFRKRTVGRVTVWCGDPDCSAIEVLLRDHLSRAIPPRLGRGATFTNTHLGNLGEAIVVLLGKQSLHPVPHRCQAMNYSSPLAGGSKTGLDVLWVYFDPTDPELDHAWIQEIKTTGSKANANYLSSLTGDYEKLFGERSSLSLEGRLGDLAFMFELLTLDPDLAKRTRQLGARSASEVTRVTLEPTGVYDLEVDPVPVIEAVRQALVSSAGWPSDRVTPHVLGVSELHARLKTVAS